MLDAAKIFVQCELGVGWTNGRTNFLQAEGLDSHVEQTGYRINKMREPCKSCSALLPVVLFGQYSGMCETCADIYRTRDAAESRRKLSYEAYGLFGAAAIALGIALWFGLANPVANCLWLPKVFAILFLVPQTIFGNFGAAVMYVIVAIAIAGYACYVLKQARECSKSTAG